jgi:hypothetical protein
VNAGRALPTTRAQPLIIVAPEEPGLALVAVAPATGPRSQSLITSERCRSYREPLRQKIHCVKALRRWGVRSALVRRRDIDEQNMYDAVAMLKAGRERVPRPATSVDYKKSLCDIGGVPRSSSSISQTWFSPFSK